MENIETIKDGILAAKKAKDIPEIKINEVNVLFLDISSNCTGYAIAKFNIGSRSETVTITKCGCLWFGSDWDHQEKYSYMYNAILTYFELVESIDFIVHEQYAVNKDRMSGVMVIPEMIGAIKVAAKENGVRVDSFTPQSWRSQIGLKPIKTEDGKKDFKTPCKEIMNSLFGSIPQYVVSNITNNNRTTPSDLYDALGLCLGWLKKHGYNNIDYSKLQFNTHIGSLDNI